MESSTRSTWYRIGDHGVYHEDHCGDVTRSTLRPVAVIEFDDPDQVERLDALYQSALDSGPEYRSLADVMRDALREFATTAAKPEEPTGLGAVVEDRDGRRWTRVELGDFLSRNPWYPPGPHDQPAEYADIAAVRVLSEGVTA